MSLKTEILKQLKAQENQAVSGQTLADGAGVTRAAVWKAIAALKKEGYAIVGTPKIGYRLSESDVLDETEIRRKLSNARLHGVEVHILPTLSSTNVYGERLLGQGSRTPAVIVTERQTDGIARRGEKFPSASGGLYMSLLFFPDLPPEKVQEVVNNVYVAVNEVLQGERRENEIWLNGQKVCGMLVECLADPDRIKGCIAGIGVYTELLPPEVRRAYPDRNALCVEICKAVLN